MSVLYGRPTRLEEGRGRYNLGMLARIDRRWLGAGVLLILVVIWAALTRFGSQDGLEATPAPSRETQLAYLSPTSGPADIYFYDPELGQSRRLTETGGVSSFSVDFEQSYLYFNPANEAGGADIWQLDLARGDARLMHGCRTANCEGLSVAPGGRWLAYERRDPSSGGRTEIWLLDLESGEAQQLSPGGQVGFSPQWAARAPAGEVLSYYNQSASAYVLANPEGGEIERFANETGRPVAWEPGELSFVAAEQFPISTDILRGPEGEAVFQTPEPGSLAPVVVAVSQLMRYSVEGSGPLFADEKLIEDAAAAFSSDGRWLAFTRKYLDEQRWTPGRQLWLLNMESGEVRQLGEDANYQITALAWNPDSRRIAFVRTKQTDFGQPAELWLLDVATGQSQLIALDAYAPGWIP